MLGNQEEDQVDLTAAFRERVQYIRQRTAARCAAHTQSTIYSQSAAIHPPAASAASDTIIPSAATPLPDDDSAPLTIGEELRAHYHKRSLPWSHFIGISAANPVPDIPTSTDDPVDPEDCLIKRDPNETYDDLYEDTIVHCLEALTVAHAPTTLPRLASPTQYGIRPDSPDTALCALLQQSAETTNIKEHNDELLGRDLTFRESETTLQNYFEDIARAEVCQLMGVVCAADLHPTTIRSKSESDIFELDIIDGWKMSTHHSQAQSFPTGSQFQPCHQDNADIITNKIDKLYEHFDAKFNDMESQLRTMNTNYLKLRKMVQLLVDIATKNQPLDDEPTPADAAKPPE